LPSQIASSSPKLRKQKEEGVMATPQEISEYLKQSPTAQEEITTLKARVNELEKMLREAKRAKIFKIVFIVILVLWLLLG
jgi:selenocysteine-specific translation elongation factor